MDVTVPVMEVTSHLPDNGKLCLKSAFNLNIDFTRVYYQISTSDLSA